MAIEHFRGKYRFLSNFYPSQVEYEDHIYPTVEHAYQAAKTLDLEERKSVQVCATPGDAKRAGRRVTTRSDWEEFKFDLMYVLLKQKFRDPYLRQLLIDTGDQEIIETNSWHDYCWGVCNGVGDNRLGKLLMKVRAEILKKIVAKP